MFCNTCFTIQLKTFAAVPELAPCPWPALTHLSVVRKILTIQHIYIYIAILPSESVAVHELAPCLSVVSALSSVTSHNPYLS